MNRIYFAMLISVAVAAVIIWRAQDRQSEILKSIFTKQSQIVDQLEQNQEALKENQAQVIIELREIAATLKAIDDKTKPQPQEKTK